MSLKKLEKCTQILAKLQLNFASIATPISLVLGSNFASIDPKLLKTTPKNEKIVDNFSSPRRPFFRKEATVAELILPYFWLIYLFLKELCSFSEVEQKCRKWADSPKFFPKKKKKKVNCW